MGKKKKKKKRPKQKSRSRSREVPSHLRAQTDKMLYKEWESNIVRQSNNSRFVIEDMDNLSNNDKQSEKSEEKPQLVHSSPKGWIRYSKKSDMYSD